MFSIFIFEGFQASQNHAISKHNKMKMQLFCLNNNVQYFRKAYSYKQQLSNYSFSFSFFFSQQLTS